MQLRPFPREHGSGFTLVELAIAMMVMTTALLVFSSTVTGIARQRATLRERVLALDAARNRLETLRSEDFHAVYALYNADGLDDPLGAGTAPGARFDVPGLTPVDAALDGLAGEVEFPAARDENENGVLRLREDLEDGDLGMPRDLSGDGVIDADDHGGDYFVLPVRVRIRWKSGSGERECTLSTQLCRYEDA